MTGNKDFFFFQIKLAFDESFLWQILEAVQASLTASVVSRLEQDGRYEMAGSGGGGLLVISRK